MIAASAAGSSVTLTLNSATYDASTLTPGTATATYSVKSDGTVSVSLTGGSGSSYSWISGGLPSNYEVRFTPTTGTVSTGTTGAWLALTTTRTITVQRTTVGLKSATVTVEIGLLGTSSALATASVVLNATVDV